MAKEMDEWLRVFYDQDGITWLSDAVHTVEEAKALRNYHILDTTKSNIRIAQEITIREFITLE